MRRVGAFWLVLCNRLVAAKLEPKNGTKRREREDNTRLRSIEKERGGNRLKSKEQKNQPKVEKEQNAKERTHNVRERKK